MTIVHRETTAAVTLLAVESPDTGDGRGWYLEWRQARGRVLRTLAASAAELDDLWRQRVEVMADERLWIDVT